MSNPRQTSLFQTSKQQEPKCRRIDRENREAARIILSEVRYQGGLMEEWAKRVIDRRETSGRLPGMGLRGPLPLPPHQ